MDNQSKFVVIANILVGGLFGFWLTSNVGWAILSAVVWLLVGYWMGIIKIDRK